MSGTVTIPSSGATISLSFGNSQNQSLAQKIANAIAFQNDTLIGGSGLFVATVSGSGGVGVAFPTNTVSGLPGELIIPAGYTGAVSIGAGDHYDYIIDESAGADTIFGFAGASIIAGGGTHTIVDPSAVVLGDTAAGSTNVVTTSGAGDNVAVGNGSNTVTGLAHGTISGGLGVNTFDLTGQDTAGYVINSQGAGAADTVLGGVGSDTVNLTGQTTVGALVQGIAGGTLVINVGDGTDTLGGRKDTIAGAKSDGMTVTNTLGRAMFMRASDSGLTTVTDISVATDTIRGGAGSLVATIGGSTTVTGGATVTGKAGFVVIGAGNATVDNIAPGSVINAGFVGTGALTATVSGAGDAVVSGDKGAERHGDGGCSKRVYLRSGDGTRWWRSECR